MRNHNHASSAGRAISPGQAAEPMSVPVARPSLNLAQPPGRPGSRSRGAQHDPGPTLRGAGGDDCDGDADGCTLLILSRVTALAASFENDG